MWIKGGNEYNDGKPVLSKEASVVIVNALLTRCDPNEKKLEYKTMKKCVKWLGSFPREKTWETEMEDIRK